MKPFSISALALFLLVSTATFPHAARADELDSPETDGDAIVLPARIADSAATSGAEKDEAAVRAAEGHAAWLKELAANPSNALNRKADRREPFKDDPTKMRCWVSGASFTVGVQNGVCKSAGRKYAFSALAIGPGLEIHSGRLKLVSNRPFPDDRLGLTGGRESLSVVIGFEGYDLTNKSGASVKGRGLGFGIGGAVELIWVTLTRL